MMRIQDDRRRKHTQLAASSDAADIAEMIEERYKYSNWRVDRSAIEGMGSGGPNLGPNLSAVTHQSLLPSVSDPRMWMFT